MPSCCDNVSSQLDQRIVAYTFPNVQDCLRFSEFFFGSQMLKCSFLIRPFILDIDECTRETVCHLNALCANTDGSFECTCKEGYDGNGTYCKGDSYHCVVQVYYNMF